MAQSSTRRKIARSSVRRVKRNTANASKNVKRNMKRQSRQSKKFSNTKRQLKTGGGEDKFTPTWDVNETVYVTVLSDYKNKHSKIRADNAVKNKTIKEGAFSIKLTKNTFTIGNKYTLRIEIDTYKYRYSILKLVNHIFKKIFSDEDLEVFTLDNNISYIDAVNGDPDFKFIANYNTIRNIHESNDEISATIHSERLYCNNEETNIIMNDNYVPTKNSSIEIEIETTKQNTIIKLIQYSCFNSSKYTCQRNTIVNRYKWSTFKISDAVKGKIITDPTKTINKIIKKPEFPLNGTFYVTRFYDENPEASSLSSNFPNIYEFDGAKSREKTETKLKEFEDYYKDITKQIKDRVDQEEETRKKNEEREKARRDALTPEQRLAEDNEKAKYEYYNGR